MTPGDITAMTILAASPFPAKTLLNDLTPDSGLALRRWTPNEFRRLVSSAVLGDAALDLADGEIVDCDNRALRLFNRDEYYSLADHGILGPDERTELIYGRIITRMSPIGRPHSIAVMKTTNALELAFGTGYSVEPQAALQLGNGLEVQPDVMIVPGTSEDYTDIPVPADVLLLVEVSDSTLRYDRSTKATLYAENAVADYWLVNIKSRTLEVRRQPENGVYVSVTISKATEEVAPLAALNAVVRVADLLPIVRP